MKGRRACVIGQPVAHSRSPLIHGFWLDAYGIDGIYDRVEVAPADLPAFFAGLRNGDYVGANVTLPHKVAAFGLCTAVTATARALGAVNTLWTEGGKVCGDNTDITGFLGALDQAAPGWEKTVENAVILGAGGGARAAVQALILRGIPLITLVNRSTARAEELAALFATPVAIGPWEALPALFERADLVVNATSLGMKGQPALDIDLAPLPAHAIVDDIVYVPLETPLLAAARARGPAFASGGSTCCCIRQRPASTVGSAAARRSRRRCGP